MSAPGIDPRVLDALQSASSLELFQLSTQFIRQMFQHIGAKAAVRIS